MVNPLHLNKDITRGNFDFRVQDAVDAGSRIESNNDVVKPLVTAGKFVRVRVAVQNQGSGERYVSTGALEIVDDQGRIFKASTDFSVSMIVG